MIYRISSKKSAEQQREYDRYASVVIKFETIFSIKIKQVVK